MILPTLHDSAQQQQVAASACELKPAKHHVNAVRPASAHGTHSSPSLNPDK